jgi:hypothetical protein
MILVGASSSESSEYEDESDMVWAEQEDERAGRWLSRKSVMMDCRSKVGLRGLYSSALHCN